MCEEADYGYASINERHPVARKEHVCCACGETIRKGNRYRTTACTGGDNGFEYYKHCLRCATMLDALNKTLPSDAAIAWELNCGEDWRDTIGELPEEVAALAFLTADEAQQKLNPVRGLERKS